MMKRYFWRLLLLFTVFSIPACSRTSDHSQMDHFRLFADGVAIEVAANSSHDTENRDQI
jgi:hypothetical protein